ncbi:hypothetical protein OQH60_02900 [Campylobacter sp. MIT 21-1685]|nr:MULTISPECIES: hypothetical protein [unclassified Campylobacter]MCX2682813.1 hypothetical protein [Campylobacter sp. MIT 21-1684]MCX2751041.1 hypothetical protein [Campylobacter sp. MIT 21-1682]MCX2807294.1 hypothetical protein [Campylobacter sp. MIT 21-1685]
MKILNCIMIVFFVCLMMFLIIGFNRQMIQKAKEREKKYKKLNKGDDNE